MQQPATTLLNSWQPCFSPAERSSWLALVESANRHITSRLDARDLLSPGIISGDAGGILILFHAAQYWDDEVLYDKAQGYLERLIDGIDTSLPLSLCSGVAGVIWLLLYLDREEIIEVEEDIISEEMIQLLCRESLQQIHAGLYDYMHKGLGTALALLCSPKHAVRYEDYFEQVISGLLATAKPHKDGMYWTYPLQGKAGNDISLGMSHGLPSIMAIVAKIRALNISVRNCDLLMEGTANFLLAHKNVGKSISLYPSMVNLENPGNNFNSRLAWCYGDPGVAAAFIHAGRATGKKEYLDEADSIIGFIARRNNESTWMNDGGFCHGTLGMAHIFNRFYQYKKDPVLKAKAIEWFNRSLPMIKRTEERMAVSMIEEEKLYWNDEPDILQGVAGISATVLSSYASVKPAWDEMFLLDIS